ncbi:MAG: A/G-specific adenine glycosylase [Betaproteobacteria bacterium]
MLPSLASFSSRLIDWQKRHGRHDLPWQQTRDAYRIWLSEIMLQQTQVSAAIPYFERFLARFPDLASLAAAPQESVLESWAGLGYYARARNLHHCARQIMNEHHGRFPERAETLATLAGIGRSTAAAIAVFSTGERAAILDGNVKRVLCRHAGVEGFPGTSAVEKRLWLLAESRLPESDIEAYTQGLMDLGATLCTRQQPRCGECPVAADCVARSTGKQAELPSPKPRTAPLPERSASFLLLHDGNAILLQRRPPSGIWGGLLVPPEGQPEEILSQLGLAGHLCRTLPPLMHTFTHFRLRMEAHVCMLTARPSTLHDPSWHWLPLKAAESAALPTPVRKLIAALKPEPEFRLVATAPG